MTFPHDRQSKLRPIGAVSRHFLALIAGRSSARAMRNGNHRRSFWFLIEAMRQGLGADAFRDGYREVAR